MELLLVVATLGIVAVAWGAVRVAGGSSLLRAPSLAPVAFAGLFLTHYVPSLYLLSDPGRPKALEFHLLVTASLCALAMGALVGGLLTRLSEPEIQAAYRVFATAPRSARDVRLVLVLGLACLGLFVLYLTDVPQWPLLRLLTGNASTAAVNKARHLVQGPSMGSRLWYFYGIARSAIMPLLFVLACLSYQRARRIRQKAFLAALAVMVFVYNSWSAAKTPVAMLFVLVAVATLIDRGEPLAPTREVARYRRRSRFLMLGCAAAVIGYPLFIFSQKAFGVDRPVSGVFREGVVGRVVGAPAYLSYFQLILFPDRYPYTDFRDVALLAKVVDVPQVDLSKLTAVSVGQSAESNAPPAAVGNFWAQGGLPVVLIGFLAIGAGFQLTQAWIVRRLPHSRLSIGFVALFCWSAWRLSMTGAHSVVLSERIFLGLVIGWLWGARRPASPRSLPRAAPLSRSLARTGGAA